MYCFAPYATPESLKRNADNFNVELVKEDVEKEYQLKEWIALEHHFDNKFNISSSFNRHSYLRFNFWWDIQNDWIAFVGANDIKEQYNTALNYDYQNWWLSKPEGERKSELEEAYARR